MNFHLQRHFLLMTAIGLSIFRRWSAPPDQLYPSASCGFLSVCEWLPLRRPLDAIWDFVLRPVFWRWDQRPAKRP